MVLTLCLGVLSTFWVSFGSAEYDEAELVQRFFETRGYTAGLIGSQTLHLEVDTEPDQGRRVLESFESEFRERFSPGSPCVYERPKGSTLTKIVAQSKGKPDVWKSYPPDSLIVKAFRDLRHKLHLAQPAQFLNCHYRTRPWIGKDHLRRETVSGVCTFLEGKTQRSYIFTYDP